MKVPLLNFVGGPGVPILNFEGGPVVALLNLGESRVPFLNFEGVPGLASQGPGPWSHFYTIPILGPIQLKIFLNNSFIFITTAKLVNVADNSPIYVERENIR